MNNAFDYGIYALTSSSVFLCFLVFIIYSRNNFNRGVIYKGIAFLLFTLSIRFFTIHLYINHLILDYPHFLLVNNLTSRIGMPVLYFVILSSLYSWKLKWVDALHLILPVLYIIHFSNIYFAPVSTKLDLIQEMDQLGYEIVWQKGIFDSLYLINGIKYLTLYGYTFLILVLLGWSANYRRLPKHLLRFFQVAIAFMLINLVPSLVSHLGVDIWDYASMIGAASTLLLTVVMFMVPDFLFPIDQIDKEAGADSILVDEKFISGSMQGKKLFQRIDSYFKEDKPFLDATFSLRQAERALGISGRYISEAIKQETGQNFSAFVNQARLEYYSTYLSKQSVISGKTVDEIAFELGFSSVNSFYQVVRKTKGCTPKEFLKIETGKTEFQIVS
jgi:AraC-like DNA-binding protein